MTERPRILSGLIVRLDLARLELPSCRESIEPRPGASGDGESPKAEPRSYALRVCALLVYGLKKRCSVDKLRIEMARFVQSQYQTVNYLGGRWRFDSTSP